MIRRHRQVKQPIAAGTAFFVELGQTFSQRFVAVQIVKLGSMIKGRLAKCIPDFVPDRLSGKFANCLSEFFAKSVVRLIPAGHAYDGNRRWQLAVRRQIVECGNQFAVSKVAGRSENHDGTRLRYGAAR